MTFNSLLDAVARRPRLHGGGAGRDLEDAESRRPVIAVDAVGLSEGLLARMVGVHQLSPSVTLILNLNS